jgi:serine/threonine-protein kinase RsbW
MAKFVVTISGSEKNISLFIESAVSFIKNELICASEDDVFEARVILNELVHNSIKHACSSRTGIIFIDISIKIINGCKLYIAVEDSGDGYDYQIILDRCEKQAKQTDCFKESGRGIMIVKGLCDRLVFNKKGNKIAILKYLRNTEIKKLEKFKKNVDNKRGSC